MQQFENLGEAEEGRIMDPHFRSRLIAAVIILIVVCSIFSVSPVAGFRLENRDGGGTNAVLAEALVLQESTKIKEAFLENITVYIDSKSEKFAQYQNASSGIGINGLYIPEEDAIYIRSDQHPERADEIFAQQVGYRLYHTGGFANSTVFPTLDPKPGSYLTRITVPPGEVDQAALFANAFMLYHTSPELLEMDAPGLYTYMDLLVKSDGNCDSADDLYTHYQTE
jgi:hypothetical protein